MRGQKKAFLYSMGIHLLACVLVFAVMRGSTTERKTLVIDFSLLNQPAARQSVQPSYETRSRPLPVKVPEPRTANAKEILKQPTPQIQRVAVTEDLVAITAPEPKATSHPHSATAAPASSMDPGITGSATGTPGPHGSHGPDSASLSGAGAGTDRPEVRYVKAHFAAIRNSIIRRLSYPRLARRMGWAGTVKVSFIVNESGGVNNVRVLETSGFEVLDANAVETIRRCSPYPKPPVVAEMVMPITYRLEE